MSVVRNEIASALAAIDPRDCRREGNSTVSHLSEPGLLTLDAKARRQALKECKHRVLRALAKHGAFLQHPDDPADYDVRGEWLRVDSKTTRLSPDLDLKDPGTDHWLFALGNWQAYVASELAKSGLTPRGFRVRAP
jgi:hypothetical protein